MKIVGVLLVAAFTTISSNFAKIFAKDIKQTFLLSLFVGLISTISGFYFSVVFDLPSGPLIVTFLGAFWILAVIYDFLKK
jgi:ABC-type Mn2+/Zn2+ transport system permease subunit